MRKVKRAIRDGPGTVVRSLHLEHYGGVETLDAAFDPAFVPLTGKEGKAVAAAQCIADGEGCRVRPR